MWKNQGWLQSTEPGRAEWYWKFVYEIFRLSLSVVGFYDNFIRRVSSSAVSYGSGSYWLGSKLPLVSRKKRGGFLYEMQRNGPFLCRSTASGSISAQKWFSAFSLARCYSRDCQSFQTGLKERHGEWVERLSVITGKLSSYGQLSLWIRVVFRLEVPGGWGMLLDSPLGWQSGKWAGLLPAVVLEKAGLWGDLWGNQQTAEMCGRLG